MKGYKDYLVIKGVTFKVDLPIQIKRKWYAEYIPYMYDFVKYDFLKRLLLKLTIDTIYVNGNKVKNISWQEQVEYYRNIKNNSNNGND